MLSSYIIKFNFITDSGILNYLNGLEIHLPSSQLDNSFM